MRVSLLKINAVLRSYSRIFVTNMKVTRGCSPKDVHFLQSMSRVGTFFGIIPSYDYRKRKLTYEKLYVCFTLFAASFVTLYSMVSLYGRFIIFEEGPATLRVLDSMVDVTGVILYVIFALGSSFWNMKTWDKLIIQLYRLNTGKVKVNTAKKNPLVFFIGGSLYYVFLAVIQLVCIGPTLFVYYINQMVQNYIAYVLINIIYNITLPIKSRYEDLNGMLSKANSINVTTTKETVKIIKEIKAYSLELDNIVETVNILFGWPILFLVAHSFAQILTSISLFTTGMLHMTSGRVLILCYLIGNMVSKK